MTRVLILVRNGDITEVHANKETIDIDVVDQDDEIDEEEIEDMERKYPYRIY